MDKKYIFPAITFTICATVAFLYWQLIYIPLQAEISRLNAETKQIEAIETELKKFQARYGNLEELLERANENLARAQELLPADVNSEKFAAEIYNAAEGKKILINSVQFGEISENDSIQIQIAKIKLEADYSSLLNFMREILDGERLVSFENFSIVQEGDSNILNCELEFKIFAANWNS